MTRKEIIEKIKSLLVFNEEKPAEAEGSEAPAVEEAPIEEAPAESQPAAEQEAQVELKEEEKSEPDYAAMQAEIQELRKKVQILDEYSYLKQHLEHLKGMQAQFSEAMTQTLALVEQISEEPTGEPAQEVRNTVFKKKSGVEKFTQHINK
jgi:hypothetical protein